MGIYSRYSAALLALALISPQVFSAVRVPVIQNDEYIRQVLSKQTAAAGAISTPAGDVAFYGAEKVYSFATGDSVAPTVREVKPWLPGQTATTGSSSFPYGPGAAYPNDPAYSPANATKLNVKPQLVTPKSNILAGLKNGLKSNPGQLALTATVAAAVSAVGWVMTDGAVVKKIADEEKPPVSQFHFKLSACGNTSRPFTSGSEFVGCMNATYPSRTYTLVTDTGWNSSGTNYYFQWTNNGALQTTNAGAVGTCSAPYSISNGRCIIPGTAQYGPLNDADLDTLDPWVSSQSAEWLGGLIRDVCNGSPNPGGCYSQMVDRSKGMISGPSVVQGPSTTKTTTYTKPDGTPGTKTQITSTKFDITYGKDHFVVDTEKKTTTTEDGQVTEEVTENDTSVPEDIADNPQEEPEPEPEYTFDDTPFPEVEPFYEQKYPDGLQGVWDQAKADIDNSNFLSFLRSFVPSFSGSCPSFGMSFAIGSMANFGTHDFPSLCYVFDFVKVILMVSAVFLARQLTFGG
ncbi:hypothetical protein RHP75_10505 [Pseudomonas sp. SG20056]|uniref:hypothetical protein n=1 Tax=Pseudomonas sp. SG20056 TaxID=3074146 RepID=UPI00287FD704|nr:hypothetical protein [Pseudomonas sp. SG20056]WNF48808.1 hypothetical protein RHP75_10465 [Pseudomonas sp. SG20056]WNF48816.1 hypothetical protein RHP75_10505 [Pseudomonas sp. SG20056]